MMKEEHNTKGSIKKVKDTKNKGIYLVSMMRVVVNYLILCIMSDPCWCKYVFYLSRSY